MPDRLAGGEGPIERASERVSERWPSVLLAAAAAIAATTAAAYQ